ncbi:tyrosine-protein kinase domain-containing protein [Winogradskyella sp. KYW1333]|uniref:GumC family protein n=1 Tax=Winogradskyella sp. KYW1333 TaxID=2282123 RepID=UPI0015F0B0DC|nr:tyrosine-protein kinase domain-containing protein [Winogradskyella sp. KYW1333]
MEVPNTNSFLVEEDNLDIKRVVGRYLRFWPWFVFTVVFALSTAYIYLKYAPRIYETTAKIKVLDEGDGLELPTAAFIFKRSNINLENEIEILNSYIISERVVRQLNLSTRFYEEGRIQTSPVWELPFAYTALTSMDSIKGNLAYKIEIENAALEITDLNTEATISFPDLQTANVAHSLPFDLRYEPLADMPLEKLEGKTYLVYLTSVKQATLNLKKQLLVESVGEQSDLLQITIKAENTERSEHILNTLIDVFNSDGIADRQLVSKRTIDFIDERFVYLAEELDSIEVNRQDFKQDNNLTDLVADAQIDLELRTQSEGEVFRIDNQLVLARLLQTSLNEVSETDLLPANIGLENGGINTLITDYNLAVINRDKLTKSGGENNPMAKVAALQVEDLKANINQSIKAYIRQLEASQNQLNTRNNKYTSRVEQLPEKEKLLRAIERQQKIKESLYLLLLQKREEAAINLAITEPSIKVVEYALTGLLPISPKSSIVYAGALLGGLLIPFGVMYLMFMLDTKVHTREDIESVTAQIPVLVELPEIKKGTHAIFSDPNATSVLAESFRILAANADYMLPKAEGSGSQVIFCTSAIKGEGKTFTSLNLSLALSSLNKKVLLIGADMRNPQIHGYIGASKKDLGLSSYLNDTDTDWKALLKQGFENHPCHSILLSGPIPPNPAHLLTNGRFEQMLAQAKTMFDYIIVDTAPTILVTDTFLISKYADLILFLTKANYTEKKLLDFSKALQASGKLKNMAYVINSVGAGKSYSYGYGYNYGYNYGYGSTA